MFGLQKGLKTTFLFEVQFHLDIRPHFQGAELPELTLASAAVVRAQAENLFPLPQTFEASIFLISLVQIKIFTKHLTEALGRKIPSNSHNHQPISSFRTSS